MNPTHASMTTKAPSHGAWAAADGTHPPLVDGSGLRQFFRSSNTPVRARLWSALGLSLVVVVTAMQASAQSPPELEPLIESAGTLPGTRRQLDVRAAAPVAAAVPAGTHVISITPPGQATRQLASTNIVVRFNSPIDPLTVNTNSFLVAGETRGRYAGSFSFAAGNTEITFTPGSAFDRGETVRIDVSCLIKDALGDAIRPWASQFAVGGESNVAEFAQGQTYGAGQKPLSVLAYDLDGDGNLDLVVANTSWQGTGTNKTISVLMGLGDGTFADKVDYVTDTADGPLPLGIAVADLDGDGDGDLVVANRGTANVAVLRNDGTGQFSVPQHFPVQGGPVRVQLGDLDGDGFLDLAATHGGLNGDGEGVSVLFGLGDGTFGTPLHISTGKTHWGLALNDLNGDGRLDLVTAENWEWTCSVFLNLGGRAFAAPAPYPVGATPRDLAVADFNGDGWPDVVTANQNGSSITISTNRLDGTLGGRVDALVNGQPVGVIAADFDGDGRPEIATANHFGGSIYNARSVTVWHNAGGGFDFHKEIFTGGSQPIALVAGDFDNDGDPDLVTANWSGNSVSLLKNAPASMTGLVYVDADGSCTQNGPDELGVGGRLVRVMETPSGVTRYASTRQDGTFAAIVPNGSYRVNLVHNATTTEACNNGLGITYNVVVTNGAPVAGLVFGPSPSCQADVTCASIISWPCPVSSPVPCVHDNDHHRRTLCPCERFQYRVTVRNAGTTTWNSGMIVELRLDPGVMFCGFPTLFSVNNFGCGAVTGLGAFLGAANPLPCSPPGCSASSGQRVRWQVNCAWPAGDQGDFLVDVQVANVPLTTVLTATPFIVGFCGMSPIGGPAFPGTPSVDTVNCSFDPNDKTVAPSGCGPSGNVALGTPLEYRVRFQNLGTAPAYRVLIRDQLDAKLDAETVEILSTSHTLTDFQILPGGQMIWTFDGINLADATSDELGSRGEVRFRIRPKSSAGEGSVILNSAAIYFDVNPPVLTATTTNTLRLLPDPAAAFTSRHSDTQAGMFYDFSYTGNTPDGADYAWDFGPDATPATSTNRNPAGIQFTTPGPKLVTLTVPRFGCTAAVAQSVDAIFIPLLCSSNLVVEATSPAGALVAFNVSTAPSNCPGALMVECLPPSGTEFPIGHTVVNCSASDMCGTTNSCSFAVDVVRPPVLFNCPGNLVLYTGANPTGAVAFYSPTANSRCESNLVVQCAPPSGSFFPVGLTPVTCVAADRCGTSNQCSFVVQVTPQPGLHLVCPPDLRVATTSATGTNVFFQVEATSDCGPFDFFVDCYPPSGSFFPIGRTTVECYGYDFACGFEATCSFAVEVVPAVLLKIARASEGVLLSWPDPSTGFALQSSAPLLSTNWLEVLLPIIVVGAEKQVTVPATNEAQFYRLFKP